jgi:hypothetical protein
MRLTAYDTRDVPDGETFELMAESFELGEFTPGAPGASATWPTFVDTTGHFSFRFPPGWFVVGNTVQSFPAAGDGLHPLPPSSIAVRLDVRDATALTGCGPLVFGSSGVLVSDDPQIYALFDAWQAKQTLLGGQMAWQGEELEYTSEFPIVRRTSMVYDAKCTQLSAFSTQELFDEPAYRLIFDSFEIHPEPIQPK